MKFSLLIRATLLAKKAWQRFNWGKLLFSDVVSIIAKNILVWAKFLGSTIERIKVAFSLSPKTALDNYLCWQNLQPSTKLYLLSKYSGKPQDILHAYMQEN